MVWGTGCYVSHIYDYFDSRGTDGREPGWRLFFTLAPQEMGRTAGAKGAFVAPQSREYAAPGRTTAATPKPAAALPAPEYTLVEFRATIWDADQVAPSVIEELYQHFNAAKTGPDSTAHWAAMEHLIRHSTFPDPKTGDLKTLNGGWPPANGGYNKRFVQPAPPDKFDRYQKKVRTNAGLPILEGTFTSPIPKNGAFDYEARALEGQEQEYDLMYEIEVLKPLPFPGEEAEIIPWHGHMGNSTQTRMVFPPKDPITGKYPWDWEALEEKGYVKITYKKSPSGKFSISSDGKTAKFQVA